MNLNEKYLLKFLANPNEINELAQYNQNILKPIKRKQKIYIEALGH